MTRAALWLEVNGLGITYLAELPRDADPLAVATDYALRHAKVPHQHPDAAIVVRGGRRGKELLAAVRVFSPVTP